jgi:sensor histidine kinase YesM
MLRLKKAHTHLLIAAVAILLNLLLQDGPLYKLNQLINQDYPLQWAEWWPTLLYFGVAVFLFYSIVLLNLALKTIFFSSQRLGPLNILLILATNSLFLISFSVIYSFLYHTISDTAAPVHSMIFRVMLRFRFPFLAAVLFAFILVLIAKVRTAEIDNARLTEEKAKAELASLKEQISPHFLFNTLSSLSSVIRQDNKKSSLEFVDKMSQVYRYILNFLLVGKANDAYIRT